MLITCTHARAYTRTHARAYTRTHARAYTRTHARAYTRTHARAYTRTHARAYTRTHARAYTHTHARTHTLHMMDPWYGSDSLFNYIHYNMYSHACVFFTPTINTVQAIEKIIVQCAC